MPDFLDPAIEGQARFAAFAGVLLAMALAEALLPRRERERPRTGRWVTNLGIVVIDGLAVRLVFPVAAIGVAMIAAERGWGLFNVTNWPGWLEGLIAFVLLDLAIYGQHVAAHKVPVLWRLHRVHHADPEFDTTTGIRFHPVEIVLSMVWKMAVVLVLGAPALAVFFFEVVLNATSLFNHANLKLPAWLDRVLRAVIVTPDMHRVHHSQIYRETDSNYGFNFSFWDRLFRTYRPQPEAGHEAMKIGLGDYPGEAPTRLWYALMIPFRGPRPPRMGERRRLSRN